MRKESQELSFLPLEGTASTTLIYMLQRAGLCEREGESDFTAIIYNILIRLKKFIVF